MIFFSSRFGNDQSCNYRLCLFLKLSKSTKSSPRIYSYDYQKITEEKSIHNRFKRMIFKRKTLLLVLYFIN
jgi:hypothetical protein